MEASASVIVFTLHDIPARAERRFSVGLARVSRGISEGITWDLIFSAIVH